MAWLSLGRALSPSEAGWLELTKSGARGLTAAFAQLLQPSCGWHHPKRDLHWRSRASRAVSRGGLQSRALDKSQGHRSGER